jgi:hypothetical protein
MSFKSCLSLSLSHTHTHTDFSLWTSSSSSFYEVILWQGMQFIESEKEKEDFSGDNRCKKDKFGKKLYRHLLQAQRKFIVYTRMKIVTRFKRRAG